jgi:hypothetical protein
MLNVTQELSNKIAAGNHWIVYNDTDIIDAHASRTAARAAKGENKVKQWDQKEGFNLLNGNGHDDSIQGVIDGAEAVGLNVVVIDENTQFPDLRSESDKAFDNPHHGHMDEEHDMGTSDKQPQSEFAQDKENMAEDPQPAPTPIDPAKEAKVKPTISHKSTVEKPTKLVHTIADMLYEADPSVTRKEIIAACTAEGIAYYTILTQYQAWKANRG